MHFQVARVRETHLFPLLHELLVFTAILIIVGGQM